MTGRRNLYRETRPGFLWTIAVLASVLISGSSVAAGAKGAADAAPTPRQAEARTVSTVIAERAMTSWILSFSGILAAREEVAIGAPFQEQRIASVEVEIGERVAAGQVLVRLETAQLENRLREAEGRVARARAALKQQEISLSQAEDKLKRAMRLRELATISEQAHSERVSAVTAAQQAVAQHQAEIAEAEAQSAEVRRQIERAEVRTPVDGIVSERLARAGALAGADPLVRLIRDGEIEFAAEIPEADLENVRPGQPVTVRLSGQRREIIGKVRVVAPKIDSTTRLGTAWIALQAPGSLFAGMFGRAEVTVERLETIMIDDTALVYGPAAEESAVFVVADGRAQRKPVTTGRRKNGKVEIRGGLLPGDRIVARSGAWLRDGDLVNPVDRANLEGGGR